MKKWFLHIPLWFAITSLMAQQSRFLDNVYRYIEDPAIFEINQEPGHVPLIPFANARDALAGDRKASGNYMSLNGTWKFYYAETPAGIPAWIL